MLADVQRLVRKFARVPETVVSQTAGGDEESAIASAVREYSRRRPRCLIKRVTSTGANYYSLTTLIPGWNLDQYILKSVSLQRNREETTIDPRDWRVTQTEDDIELRFLGGALSSGQVMHLEYLAPHRLDNSVDTVALNSPDDVEALAHLAASQILTQAANHYIPQTNSSVRADSIDQVELRRGYALQARDELATFERMMASKPSASSVRVQLDVEAYGGTQRFFQR